MSAIGWISLIPCGHKGGTLQCPAVQLQPMSYANTNNNFRPEKPRMDWLHMRSNGWHDGSLVRTMLSRMP